MAGYTRRAYAGAAVQTTITGNLTVGASTISIAAYTNWPYGSSPFYVVVDAGTASEEKILVTRTGSTDTTLTVNSRGVDGTSAAAHSAGAKIMIVFTATDADEANAVASTLGTKGDILVHTGSAHAALPVGSNGQVLTADSTQTNGVKWSAAAVGDVTLTGTQTLTNKTIALGSNTVSGTLAQFNTAVTDADLVSLAGTETLTNKTLTTPVISSISNSGTVTLPTGTRTLVARDTTDTLTNKTIALGSNTVSGTLAQFNTAVTDADLASLTGSETLTNKTIALGSNTVSGTLAQFNTAVTDADLVSLAGTETLTNKTLTSPTVNSATITGGVVDQLQENWNIVASAATGTINLDVKTASVWYYTSNASANHTLNVRGDGSTTLSSLLAVGDSITVVWAVTNGATPYYPSTFQVDGSSITPKWQGGTAPSAGNASSVDIYTFVIVKTAATPTYTVFGSQTQFK